MRGGGVNIDVTSKGELGNLLIGLPYGPKKTGEISILIEDLSKNSIF